MNINFYNPGGNLKINLINQENKGIKTKLKPTQVENKNKRKY